MGWTQQIEYVDAEVTLPPPVKKMIWDGEKFMPMTLYKLRGVPTDQQMTWLESTYGYPGIYRDGQYWDFSYGGNFTVMDERVYTWFQIKWGNK